MKIKERNLGSYVEQHSDELASYEVERVLDRALSATPSLTDDQLDVIAKWTRTARLNQVLLMMALNGEIVVGMKDGEVAFHLASQLPTQSVTQ